MKILVFADPGHAWAKVSRKKLIDLGIEHKISHYSYQKGDHVFLEEDQDLSTLVNALKEKGIEYSFKTNHTNRQSRIRGYSPFQPKKD